jgi:diaminohydroxyphosphoribosylaminopyrimidine deaminase/5-amino-6-(5-phosphoribosylamino)uracil reductase
VSAPTFTAAEHAHMAYALRLAARGLYSTPPNPAVGCVILDAAGRVVGEGWHRRAGEAHAEPLALAAAGAAARGGTALVTLEPCSHHGRTPPCVEALVAVGIARVIAATGDPNPRVAGTGLARLREAGIETAVGLCEAQARELNRGFFSRMERGRPWVTLKLGSSVDGRTALADGSSQWITSAAARADVQRLRARAAAIITGVGTVLADDPALTVRDPALDLAGRVPLRVVLDAQGRTPATAKLLTDGKPTLVLTAATVAVDAGGRIDLAAALRHLAQLECNEVLVEAGPRLAGSFLAAGLADELVLYVAPTVLGDVARPAFALPQPLATLAAGPRFRFHDVRQVGPDLRLTLRPAEV